MWLNGSCCCSSERSSEINTFQYEYSLSPPFMSTLDESCLFPCWSSTVQIETVVGNRVSHYSSEFRRTSLYQSLSQYLFTVCDHAAGAAVVPTIQMLYCLMNCSAVYPWISYGCGHRGSDEAQSVWTCQIQQSPITSSSESTEYSCLLTCRGNNGSSRGRKQVGSGVCQYNMTLMMVKLRVKSQYNFKPCETLLLACLFTTQCILLITASENNKNN